MRCDEVGERTFWTDVSARACREHRAVPSWRSPITSARRKEISDRLGCFWLLGSKMSEEQMMYFCMCIFFRAGIYVCEDSGDICF